MGEDKFSRHGYHVQPRNTCWVSNPEALVNLQNCYYWMYYNYVKGGDYSQAAAEWWGWSEIAVLAAVDDPKNGYWAANMIFLPASLAGQTPDTLSPDVQENLYQEITKWEKEGKLLVGFQYIKDRPGSYFLMANEQQWTDSNQNWYHTFFCAPWTYADIQICFKSRKDDVDKKG